MTDTELEEKEIEVLNKYLGDETRKISIGQVLKTKFVNEILKEISEGYEGLYEIGKKLREEIEPYRYLLEEGRESEYLETTGRILWGKPNPNISRPEVNT